MCAHLDWMQGRKLVEKPERLRSCVVQSGNSTKLASCCRLFRKGRDTRCDKSLRHVAATGCCNKSPRVTCENYCRCDRILSLRSVARIQTGLNSCDKTQRQNKRKQPCRNVCTHLRQVAATKWNQPLTEHQLVPRHVKFELVYISSLSKSIACTEHVSYRSDLSQHQCRREDLSPRFVASCVSALIPLTE